MILKETLRKIVQVQRANIDSLERGVKREKLDEIDFRLPHAMVLSGIRRCGKSTLLSQIMPKTKNFYYLNFEDPKTVNFEVDDFDKLDEVFAEEYGKCDYYFFDEIQNVEKWELFVRALLDKNKKVIITGSNASLFSKELGTRLTGRHLRYELFPFSFKEMLTLTKKEPNIKSFEDYLNKGGFPEFLKYQRPEILQELLNDILARDIVVRHKLRNIKIVKEIAVYLLTNVGKEFSYNSLKKAFNLGSVNSIISFISYFEEAYLLFTLPKFDYSLKKQLVNPKKIYSVDNGMSNFNSASFSLDKGRMLENIVFLNLRKKYKNLFYFKEKNECDFIVKDKKIMAIQVCYDLNEDNKKRELGGLLEAMRELKLKNGLILTFNQEDKLKMDNKEILVKPVWKWL